MTSSSGTASSQMAKNRMAGGRAERALRSVLWRRGFRFRLHQRELPGKPDLVFRTVSLCVFCDGDFWHGREWRKRRTRLESGSNREYWVAKIQSNIQRDRNQTRQLRAKGWTVLRIWESTVLDNPERAADLVVRALQVRLERAPDPRLPKTAARVAGTANARGARRGGEVPRSRVAATAGR